MCMPPRAEHVLVVLMFARHFVSAGHPKGRCSAGGMCRELVCSRLTVYKPATDQTNQLVSATWSLVVSVWRHRCDWRHTCTCGSPS
eukprot:365733-Chlamydomonas_euryale.AAC.20